MSRLDLLRRPESNRQSSGYEPDGIPLPYPAVEADYTTRQTKRNVRRDYLKYRKILQVPVYRG